MSFHETELFSKYNPYFKRIKVSFMFLLPKSLILLLLINRAVSWPRFLQNILIHNQILLLKDIDNYFIFFEITYAVFLTLWIIVLFFKWLFQKGILGSSQITLSSEEASSVLVGMLKSQKSIKISDIAETTGMPETHWKTRIYQLIGDDKISGEFNGVTFTPSEDENISDLIDHLMGQYEKMEEDKVGKME
ncbi:MAG: hypothetical protein INQ03_09125 [Candidatus Heimdallarchaeota archaeon]|nr:hypothetical protein [Candidatus Heimdallarchaeota archaeon]